MPGEARQCWSLPRGPGAAAFGNGIAKVTKAYVMNLSWLAEVAETLRPGIRASLPAQFPDSISQSWHLAERAAGVTEAQLVAAVATHFSMPVANLEAATPAASRLLPYALALRHRVLPLGNENGQLRVAVCDPTNADSLERLRFTSTQPLVLEIQHPARIENAVLRIYGEAAQREAQEVIDLDATPTSEVDFNPVVRVARKLLRMAAERRASDLHLQPYMGGYLVRARVDGVLLRMSTLTHDVGVHVVRHFKATAGMDSTDAYAPADGRGTIYIGDQRYDLRMSTVPNAQGERLVIRLLNQSRVFSLERLGYAPARAQTLRRLTQLDSGLVLFVGPTGSGKTTSLYALISTLNSMERSIATIEQPVEYIQPGLSQVEVRPERGASFASVLRAQLRQDPDILLIGEIRDHETAEAAVRAALTGHLVFSTLHSSTARYSVPRLLDLGISAPMIGETLRAVVSQRLVRKLCRDCAAPVTDPLSPAERLFQEITQERPKMRAVGCEKCSYAGYLGVMPVVELFIPSSRERLALLSGQATPDMWDVDAPVQESGNPDDRSMPMRVLDLIVSGETTAEEGAHVMGYGFWTALARHFSHVGWFSGSTSDAALASRSENATDVLVSGADAGMVADLAAELGESGYRVVRLDPLADPRGVFVQHPNVSLLLLDLQGDDAAAESMLRALRQNFAWSGLPAIILVPAEAPAVRHALEQRIANRVVSKPATAVQVADAIRSLTWGNE